MLIARLEVDFVNYIYILMEWPDMVHVESGNTEPCYSHVHRHSSHHFHLALGTAMI